MGKRTVLEDTTCKELAAMLGVSPDNGERMQGFGTNEGAPAPCRYLASYDEFDAGLTAIEEAAKAKMAGLQPPAVKPAVPDTPPPSYVESEIDAAAKAFAAEKSTPPETRETLEPLASTGDDVCDADLVPRVHDLVQNLSDLMESYAQANESHAGAEHVIIAYGAELAWEVFEITPEDVYAMNSTCNQVWVDCRQAKEALNRLLLNEHFRPVTPYAGEVLSQVENAWGMMQIRIYNMKTPLPPMKNPKEGFKHLLGFSFNRQTDLLSQQHGLEAQIARAREAISYCEQDRTRESGNRIHEENGVIAWSNKDLKKLTMEIAQNKERIQLLLEEQDKFHEKKHEFDRQEKDRLELLRGTLSNEIRLLHNKIRTTEIARQKETENVPLNVEEILELTCKISGTEQRKLECEGHLKETEAALRKLLIDVD